MNDIRYTKRVVGILNYMVLTVLVLFSFNVKALELETILNNTAIKPPSQVSFREERHNSMLKQPIILTGRLEYIKEGQLRKLIETPFVESYLVTDEFIEIGREGTTRRLSHGKSKAMRSMLGGIEAVLAGQADKLSVLFETELTGTESEWSLQLRPLSKRVASHLTSMLVLGNQQAITSIRVNLSQSEWSLMEIPGDIDEP